MILEKPMASISGMYTTVIIAILSYNKKNGKALKCLSPVKKIKILKYTMEYYTEVKINELQVHVPSSICHQSNFD